LESTAIPVGKVNPEKVWQEDEQLVKELVPEGISMIDPDEVSLVIQMSLLESTAIPVGEVNPEKVRQGVVQKTSVTDPFPVTQMSLLESIAIPTGEKGRLKRLHDEGVAQVVAPAEIAMSPVLVATQTLFWWSTAIFPKGASEGDPGGGEKVKEEGAPPPVPPPPPIPQEARERRKKRPRRRGPAALTPFFIRFPPDSSPTPWTSLKTL
jgi:hypothetical protein